MSIKSGQDHSDIKRIISNDDFNTIEALKSHKNILQQDLDRKQNLIKTIDKTIAHTPEFRKFYDERHPKLLEFMINAMQIYANEKL